MSETRPTPSDARLRAIAAGESVEAHEADALLASPDARARLAESDPSALFAALGPLEVDLPEMPKLDALPERRESRGARPAWRTALGLAAASIALACLLALTEAPAPGRAPSPAAPAAREVRASLSLPPVVERVQSPTAQIVALVPPSAEGPTVTLILDEEIDP